ncbi:MAG: ATP-dependent Lon protease [Nocardioidaceae bacterium]|nr:ATP-dependent Lon protease [Nocardioidaceae bacterium]
MPMFPLGTVLFPSAVLPLHVFEPRYRQLVHDCLEGDPEFGVVLIERGSEVGGFDLRSMAGTVARIVEAVELDDGRWALGTVGTRRIRVEQWLADDPYPRAEIDDWLDPAPSSGYEGRLREVVTLLRRSLALKAELGEPAVPATIELSDDPVLAGYQAAAVSPVGPLDGQRLLSANTPDARVEMLAELLSDEVDVLGQRLAGG